jgi:hypothetical protein
MSGEAEIASRCGTWAHGTTHLRFDPLELLEHLAVYAAAASQSDSLQRSRQTLRSV